jgi:DNA-binding beta-propeller fold protein YncE
MPQKGSGSVTVSVTDQNDELITGAVVTFASSNPSMVTVTNLGVISSVGPAGTTSVIAKSGKASTSIPITVTPVTSGITVTPDPVSLAQKTTLQLQAKVVDAVGAEVPGGTITYIPANPAMITVSSSGLLTSLGTAGSTSVTLTSGTVARTLNVTVTQVATDLVVAPSTLRLGQHGQAQLSATVIDAVGAPMPSSGTTWSSGDQNLVTISASGLVTSVGPTGTSSITVRNGTFTRTIPVEVATVVHPSATNITSIPFVAAWGIGVSSSGVILAPSSDGIHTYRVDPVGQTATAVSGVAGGIDISFSTDGTRAYVAGFGTNRIDIIDVASNTVVGTFGTAVQPLAVQVSRDNQTLYVGTSGLVVAYDLNTRTEKTRISVPGAVNAISIHPSLDLIYATGFDANTVSEINTTTNAVTRAFHTNLGPAQESVVSANGNTLYVATESGELDVFDLTTGSQQPAITGAGGFGAALTPDGLQLWVVGGSALKIVDLAARTFQTITLPSGARRIVFTPDGSAAVITGDGSNLIFVR